MDVLDAFATKLGRIGLNTRRMIYCFNPMYILVALTVCQMGENHVSHAFQEKYLHTHWWIQKLEH